MSPRSFQLLWKPLVQALHSEPLAHPLELLPGEFQAVPLSLDSVAWVPGSGHIGLPSSLVGAGVEAVTAVTAEVLSVQALFCDPWLEPCTP